jgi:hypothetical protein
MRCPSSMRPLIVAGVVAALVSACAASSPQAKTPATGAHPSAWYTIGAGRADYQKSLHDFDQVSADCTLACKALASLKRAADHLCVVAEPEECSDARVRVDRARRAVEAQCGGCD